ncbi:hypothetical protein [Burkholderia sp. IMCC1007]|uniref:hypothetical protein n=1 Tax=Burkholderia sp. IMCC1007 TaxID=3004104 RepID=UPI0022B5A9AF|nr:hypothetical protein [Burkholderia sp. IMCC1007]
MTDAHTIALVVDPACAERIREIAAGVRHTWVVTSDANDAVIEQIWHESRTARMPGNAGGVTKFGRYGDDPESWSENMLDAIEEHHGGDSPPPCYTALDVHGTALSARLRAALDARGFAEFMPTRDGFRAVKRASSSG